MSHTITGRLHLKGATTQVSEKFVKRDFVIIDDSNPQYPQYISLQLAQDKCSILDNILEGTTLTAHFNIRGREWNGPQGLKYFNTLDAWKIETASQTQQGGSNPQYGNPAQGQQQYSTAAQGQPTPTGSTVQAPANTSQQARPAAAQPVVHNNQPIADDLPF